MPLKGSIIENFVFYGLALALRQQQQRNINSFSSQPAPLSFSIVHFSSCRLTVGTAMEGNFLVGTKSPKKVVRCSF